MTLEATPENETTSTVDPEVWRALSCAEQTLVKKGYTFTGFWTRRCPHKDCGHRFRVEAPVKGYSKVVELPCPQCGWVSKRTDLCHARRIFGRESLVHECGSKCYNATGPSCDCSCRGENHGSGHPLKEIQVVTIPE